MFATVFLKIRNAFRQKIHDIRKRMELYIQSLNPTGIFMEQKWNVHAKYFSFNDDMLCEYSCMATRDIFSLVKRQCPEQCYGADPIFAASTGGGGGNIFAYKIVCVSKQDKANPKTGWFRTRSMI